MTESGRGFILVVDDSDANRYATVHSLRRGGFEVVEATTIAEALELVLAHPDLVVLDVNLPDGSGLDVCRRLKADVDTSTIPVLMLTASLIGAESRVLGLEMGADGYLTQPVEPIELVATVRALLRARRAEEQARVAAGEWQATFDAITDGVALVAPDGTLVRCNVTHARMLGRDSASLVGLPYRELVEPILGPDALATLDVSGELRARVSAEARSRDRWYRVARDGVGPGAGWVYIVSDVTETKRLEEGLRQRARALAEADRRKDEFLAMLAHELRTPLGPIVTAAHLIQMRVPGDDKAAVASGVIERQVRHMARLVDDLLDVSRITRGKIVLKRERVEFGAVLARALESTRPQAEARLQRIEVEGPATPVYVDADPTRIEQVLSNLLGNAIKYTDRGGSIHISSGTEAGEIVCRVADSGIGIEPEMLPRVFDLFSQADRSLERSRGGLGIGLTLVKNLVAMHGGRVEATSEGPGKGSVFTMRLPASACVGEPVASATAAAAAPAPEPSGLFVLVVEDNEDAREMLESLLGTWDHRVETAEDGERGLELALTRRPDVALIDIGLPGLDGYELARRLRASDEGRALRLVALTGYGRTVDRERALEAGFDAHLVKPVEPDALRRVLRTH